MTFAGSAGVSQSFAMVAACILLAAFLLACNGDDAESTTGERLLLLEAEAHSLEESLEALHEENEGILREVNTLRDENAALNDELAALRQEQAKFVDQQVAAEAAREHEEEVADFEEVQEEQLAALTSEVAALKQAQAEFVEQQEAAEAAREHAEEVADFEEGQEEQLAALEEGQSRTDRRLDELDERVEELEAALAKAGWDLPSQEERSKNGWSPSMGEAVLERTAALAEDAGGEVYRIDSGQPEERAILVMPVEPIDGNPLIVSLHGYGSNTAAQSGSFPLHREVVSRGFGLLLPNGTSDGEGNQSWNPTDLTNDSGKASADDFAYLADLVARAKELKDFGPVYLFGYSNGGFMAYHLACKGLPGLRAVASLAGTSYYDDAECEGAPPVSVLHIHGSADDVILYGGEVAEPRLESEAVASYASALEMVMRWGDRAGCEWPKTSTEFSYYTVLDLDMFVRGPETYAYRLESGCADGIDIRLWQGVQSGHAPGYLHAFLEALLDWLLSQE